MQIVQCSAEMRKRGAYGHKLHRSLGLGSRLEAGKEGEWEGVMVASHLHHHLRLLVRSLACMHRSPS
jgi:hypothetical protein